MHFICRLYTDTRVSYVLCIPIYSASIFHCSKHWPNVVINMLSMLYTQCQKSVDISKNWSDGMLSFFISLFMQFTPSVFLLLFFLPLSFLLISTLHFILIANADSPSTVILSLRSYFISVTLIWILPVALTTFIMENLLNMCYPCTRIYMLKRSTGLGDVRMQS